MKPSELTGVLEAALRSGNVPLLLGHPGIGKTAIIKQTAARMGWKVEEVYPALSLPEHFQGFPFCEAGKADFRPIGWLRRLVEATEPVLCFLDEIDKATVAVQSVAAQLVYGRTVGGERVPDCVRFALAANRAEDRSGGVRLVNQLVSRCWRVGVECDATQWLEWAEGAGIHAAVRAYISRRPERLDEFNPACAQDSSQDNPRGWECLSRHLAVSDALTIEVAAGYVSDRSATEFVQFRDLLMTLPTFDEVVAAPGGCRIPERPDAAYAVASMLVQMADAPTSAAVCQYLARMAPEIAMYGLAALKKRNKEFTYNKPAIDWMTSTGTKLI